MNSTSRFSDRVDAYVRYRPNYPDELIELLQRETGLGPGTIVADIGSGTGISTELFLRHGMAVHAVEPNEGMRKAAEDFLGNYEGFESVNATAEETTLPDKSVELIAAGQAFHWFDRERAHREFQRILRPGGWVILFWNSRLTEGSRFLEEYERMLLRFGTDYQQINHQNIADSDIEQFFAPATVSKFGLINRQIVDFEGAKGRLDSSSYVPTSNDPSYIPMINELRRIFDETEEGGKVTFEYDLQVYLSQLSQPE